MVAAPPHTPLLAVRDSLRHIENRDRSFRRPRRSMIEMFCACLLFAAPFGIVHAEEPAPPAEMPSLPAAEIPTPTPEVTSPVPVDPFVQLRGSVWRTKAGIAFLKTPIGLLTLSSKTTLKDLKASHEVRFWVHDHHSVVEIRKRTDGSLVHRYLSGPMTPGTDAPGTLRWWGPEGDLTVSVGTQEERLKGFHEGDPLTVEVDETNTIRGIHDLQFDLQISQVPPSGAEVQVLLSGTVSKLKSNFVFVRTPVGLVMLNSKIGLPHVKVGQPLTVHIDHERVTVTSPSTLPSTQRSAKPSNRRPLVD